MLNIFDQYTIVKTVGSGGFAKVSLAQRKIDNKEFAIKTMSKAKIMESRSSILLVYKEVKVMRLISHPNIIKLFEVYEDELYVHLVIEYLSGGELLQRMQCRGVYTEKDALQALEKILKALDYCHSRNIIHRDLKLVNLILS